MIFTKAANLAFLCQHRQCAGKQRNKNLSKTILSQTDLLRTYGAVSNLNTGGKCSVNACASWKNEFRKSPHLATLSYYAIFIRYPKEFILEICMQFFYVRPVGTCNLPCSQSMHWLQKLYEMGSLSLEHTYILLAFFSI